MNEAYDLAACGGESEVAADALHALAPDELMMRAEEHAAEGNDQEAAARCLLSLMTAITWRTTSVVQVRDRLAWVCSTCAPDMLPAQQLWHGRVEWAAVRAQMAICDPVQWHAESGRVLIGLLTKKGWSEREVGLRSLCMVYAFQPNEAARPVIARSFEAIGAAVGLKAKNKRSGVSAAMARIVLDLMHGMQRLTRKKGSLEFWFMKKAHCREALSQSMKGKKNRLKKEQ